MNIICNTNRWILALLATFIAASSTLYAAPPVNDNFSSILPMSGIPVEFVGSNIDATLEPGERLPTGVARASVWFRWTATISGRVRIDTIGSGFDTLLTVWQGDQLSDLGELATNDDYDGLQSAVFIDATAGSTYQIAVYGYADAAGAFVLSISSDLSLGISGTITGPDGTTPLAGIRAAAHRWNAEGGVWALITSAVTDGSGNYSIEGLSAGTYRVRFQDWLNDQYLNEVYDSDVSDLDSGRDIVVSAGVPATGINASLALKNPLTNDHFASPVVLSGVPANYTGSNKDATLEANEPLPNGFDNVVETSVWFRWTATTSGSVRIDTIGSGFDTILSVWEGDQFSNLVEVAMNDDYDDFQSTVFINATSGKTYWIAVYGYAGAAGPLSLNISSNISAAISGTITGPDGTTPLAGVRASALSWNADEGYWGTASFDVTDTNGNYSIEGLTAGTYRVRFQDWLNDNYLSEVYDDVRNIDSGVDIFVDAATPVSGINASLALAVAPSNDPFGSPVVMSGVPASITGFNSGSSLEPDEPLPIGSEASAGKSVWFRWTATTSGPVQIDTIGSDFDTLLTVWEGDHLSNLAELATNDDYDDLQSAVFINATAGSTYQIAVYGHYGAVGAIVLNISTDISSGISGTITWPDGTTPLVGIRATAYNWNAGGGDWEQISSDMTDTNGNYSIRGLAAGTYRVKFEDWVNGHFFPEVFPNAPDIDSGTNIVVGAAAVVTGINASLAGMPSISGTVTGSDGTTPLAGVDAAAFRWNVADQSWDRVATGQTDASGNYRIRGLTAGTYRVRFGDEDGGFFVSEVYEGATDLRSGTDIMVGEAASVIGINASLDTPSSISGTVYGPDGSTPLAGIAVVAYRLTTSDWQWVRQVQTDSGGLYSLGELPAGTYRVQYADYQNGAYLTETYGGDADLNSGTDILVGVATDIAAINAALSTTPPPTANAGPDQTVVQGEIAPWTPAVLPLVAWYDAADADTIVASSGSVSQWKDKSGNGYHLLQGTGSARPSYSFGQKVTFDGVNDHLKVAMGASLPAPFSVYCVTEYHGANTDNQYIFNTTGGSALGESNTGGWGVHNGVWLRDTLLNPIEIGILSAVYNGASSDVYRDGMPLLSGDSGSGSLNGTNALGSNYTGDGSYFKGDIREFIVVSSADVVTHKKIEGYLAHKWGLTGKLPANEPNNHPYRDSAPTTAITLAGTAITAVESPATTSWSVINQPAGATVNFTDASALDTAVSFSATGTYVLRLTADDGRVSVYDEVTITVTFPEHAVSGFNVDTTKRSDVLAFYNCVYKASEDYAAKMNWTGNMASGIAGTTSQAYKNDVLRRINFYRAMCGLPADITLNATKSEKCQQAALILAAHGALSHTPQPHWPYYTVGGAEAADKSNLVDGAHGPRAVDQQIQDPGDYNYFVGHRRGILYSRLKETGTGNFPNVSGSHVAYHLLWMLGDYRPTPAPKFVSWPNSGYVPDVLSPVRWSLSYPGANFASASVTMTTMEGTPVATTIISSTDDGYGDNSLVWVPAGIPQSVSSDMTYNVTVSGISGAGIPTSHTYSVTLFNPNVLDEFVTIEGSDTPSVDGGNYTFNSIYKATAYELRVSTAATDAWSEGAEDLPTSRIEENVNYTLRQTALKRSGSKAFQLTFTTGGTSNPNFVITRDILPSSSSELQFYERARLSTLATRMQVEVSTDNGGTWTSIFSRNGVGMNTSQWDANWIARSIPLSSYAGQVICLRFSLKSTGAITTGATSGYGFFIDDITVTNAPELIGTTYTALFDTSFTLNAATAGSPLVLGADYYMSIRPYLGCRYFGYGPYKVVTAGVFGGFATDTVDGSIEENQTITYTVDFGEDIDAATVDSGDFGNAGTSAVVFGAITEISPGVFTIQVTPTTVGSVQLFIATGAMINLANGDALNISSPLIDHNTITVIAINNQPLVDAGEVQTVVLETDPQTPWTPANITTAAWYDAADASMITQSGGAVSQWNDKSGNHHHVTQSTVSARPAYGTRTINGLNVCDFDGVDDKMTLASRLGFAANPDILVVGVMLMDGASQIDTRFWSIGDGAHLLSGGGGTEPWAWRFDGGTERYNPVSFGSSELSAWMRSAGSNYGASRFFQDGTEMTVTGVVSSTSVPTNTGALLALGAGDTGNFANGVIGELVFLSDQTTETRQKLEGYLAHKWGMSANLPVGHPYKNAAPTEGSGTTAATSTLAGSASDADDELLSITWSVVSTPAGGNVTFSDASALNTAATFTTAGVYVLRLTADDGRDAVYDEVTITVTSTVNAGPDQTVSLVTTPAPWSPTPPTNPMTAWYDAADAATIIQSGNKVSQWKDKSGNGKHLLQGTGTAQPTYTSGQKVTFDGFSDYLHRDAGPTQNAPFSFFCVTEYNNTTVENQIIFDSSGPNYDDQFSSFGHNSNPFDSGGIGWGMRNGVWLNSVELNPIALGINSAVYNGASSAVYRDGSSVLTGNAGSAQLSGEFTMGSHVFGGALYFKGDIREFIIVPGVDIATRQKYEGYLAHKWGLAGNLPAAHPYKNAAPTTGSSITSASATLAGSAVTVVEEPLSSTWSVISKPSGATVTIANASALDTTVTFTALGTYVLRLTATRASSTAYDEVIITVGENLPAPVASFSISGIPSQVGAGTAITGVTLTALDADDQVATSFTGTVTFGGTAGITGTSANFVAGVLGNVSITPMTIGTGLTFTVDDGSGHLGSSTFRVVNPSYNAWTIANSLTGADADPDAILRGDGLTNLQKFAFGIDPNTGGSGPITFDGNTVLGGGMPTLWMHSITENSVDYRVVLPRRKDYAAAGITYTIQFGSELSNWVTVNTEPTGLADQGHPDIDAVYISYPKFIQTPRGFEKPKFFRVGVSFAE